LCKHRVPFVFSKEFEQSDSYEIIFYRINLRMWFGNA